MGDDCLYTNLAQLGKDIQNLKLRNSREEDEKQCLEAELARLDREQMELKAESQKLAMERTIAEKELQVAMSSKTGTLKDIDDLSQVVTKKENYVTALENQTKHLKLLGSAKCREWTETIKRFEDRMLQSPAGKQKRETTRALDEATTILNQKISEYDSLKEVHDDLYKRKSTNWDSFVASCVKIAQYKKEAKVCAEKLKELSAALEKANMAALSNPVNPTSTGLSERSLQSMSTFVMNKFTSRVPTVQSLKSATPVLQRSTKPGIVSNSLKTWPQRFGTATTARTTGPAAIIVPKKLKLDCPPPPPMDKNKVQSQAANPQAKVLVQSQATNLQTKVLVQPQSSQVSKPQTKVLLQSQSSQVTKPQTTPVKSSGPKTPGKVNPNEIRTPKKDSKTAPIAQSTPSPFLQSGNDAREPSHKTLDLENTSGAMELEMMDKSSDTRPPTPSTLLSPMDTGSGFPGFDSGLFGLNSNSSGFSLLSSSSGAAGTKDSGQSSSDSEDFFMKTFGLSPLGNLF